MIQSLALALLFFTACSSPQQVTSLELGSSGWIPFDFHNDEHIVLRGTINGHEIDLVLDTGAEISLIDKSFAESIGLRAERDLLLNGVAGGTNAGRVRAAEISIDNITIHNPLMAITDLSGFKQAVDRPLSAILSVEVFAQAIVDLDYPNRRIAFRRTEDFKYDGPGHTVQLKPLHRGRHAIQGAIENHPPVWYLVDTGSSSTITIAASLARNQALLEGRERTSEQVSGGVGGLMTEAIASVERFSIGDYSLLDMPIAIASGELSKRTDSGFDGIVGNGVLGRFRIIFDFGRNELHLEPGPMWQSREFPRNLFGLAVVPTDDGLRVLFVAPGSPSQKAGWQTGMFVTGVDGVRGPVPELRAALRARNAAGAGTHVVLLDDRGVERSVVLARYY